MKEFIVALLKKWSCSHEWDTYHVTETYDRYETSWTVSKYTQKSNNRPILVKHTLICKKCGKIKKINV